MNTVNSCTARQRHVAACRAGNGQRLHPDAASDSIHRGCVCCGVGQAIKHHVVMAAWHRSARSATRPSRPTSGVAPVACASNPVACAVGGLGCAVDGCCCRAGTVGACVELTRACGCEANRAHSKVVNAAGAGACEDVAGACACERDDVACRARHRPLAEGLRCGAKGNGVGYGFGGGKFSKLRGIGIKS